MDWALKPLAILFEGVQRTAGVAAFVFAAGVTKHWAFEVLSYALQGALYLWIFVLTFRLIGHIIQPPYRRFWLKMVGAGLISCSGSAAALAILELVERLAAATVAAK